MSKETGAIPEVLSIRMLGQTIDLTNGQNREALTHFEGKDLVVLASVGANKTADGDYLLSQVLLGKKLKDEFKANSLIVAGACTLQRHTIKMKRFSKIAETFAKRLESEIRILEKNISFLADSKGPSFIARIQDQISALRELKQKKQQKQLLEAIFSNILQECGKIDSSFQTQINNIFELAKNYTQHQTSLAKTITLQTGNEWQRALKLKLASASIGDINITRWSAIYDEELEPSPEYETYKALKPTEAIGKLKFTGQDKTEYQRKISDLFTKDPQFQEAIKLTIDQFLNGASEGQSKSKLEVWRDIVGYPEQECRDACKDYLMEECAWLAYLAEKHPEVIILYGGDLSPAIKYTFEKFHPQGQVNWFAMDVNTPTPKLAEKGEETKADSPPLRAQSLPTPSTFPMYEAKRPRSRSADSLDKLGQVVSLMKVGPASGKGHSSDKSGSPSPQHSPRSGSPTLTIGSIAMDPATGIVQMANVTGTSEGLAAFVFQLTNQQRQTSAPIPVQHSPQMVMGGKGGGKK